jgi:hypothetical protein
LTLPEEIDRIREAFKEIDYFESSEPWTFKSTKMTLHRFMKVEGEKYLMIDILLANEERHRQMLARSIHDEWREGRIRIISKNDLIWMKKQECNLFALNEIELEQVNACNQLKLLKIKKVDI